jgi:hypothetical protein
MRAARLIPSAHLAAAALAAGLGMLVLPRAGFGQDDALDRIDTQLSFSSQDSEVRARISGTLDLEGYSVSQPAPGLQFDEGNQFFVPRLSLFLDAQLGRRLYAFVQARADNGFDPGEGGPAVRLDEYVLRYTPWENGALNLQVGKFATVVGNWTLRHGSWDNPFITAPLPYEDLTGIWDVAPVRSVPQLQAWAGVRPMPTAGGAFLDVYRNVPIIWGPSYGSGAAALGDLGKFDYAFEVKNTSLSGRPETWSPTETQWQQPTFSGRLGYRPDEAWNLGVSASEGPYLQPGIAAVLPPGRTPGQYLETVLGQDVSYAWHHFQLWAEVYEAAFKIPGVGDARTQAYYVEAKYKFTPQLFGAIRWNQQIFSPIATPTGAPAEWSRNVWRIDAGPCYRLTPHVQLKLQYSAEYQQAASENWGSLLAVQFTTRF